MVCMRTLEPALILLCYLHSVIHRLCFRLQTCACPFNLFLLSSGSLSYDIWFCAVRMRKSYLEEWYKISLTFSNGLTILVLYPNAFRNAALAARKMPPHLSHLKS